MLSNSEVFGLTVLLNLWITSQTLAWSLGPGNLPTCARHCLDSVLSKESSCKDLKCFCQNYDLVNSTWNCFRNECDSNSLPTAFKLMASCQESYGSMPSSTQESSPNPPAVPSVPAVTYVVNPYFLTSPIPTPVYPNSPGSQLNGVTPVLIPQSQASATGLSSGSRSQGPATGVSSGFQSLPQAQAPEQASGGELSPKHQLAEGKVDINHTALPLSPSQGTATPLLPSMKNSSSSQHFSSARRSLENENMPEIFFFAILILALQLF